MKTAFLSCLGLCVCLLAGCSSSQVDSRQPLPLTQRYDSSPYPTPELVSSLSLIFSDAQLHQLTQQALRQNPDLAAAAARLEESGFVFTQVRAPLFPALDGTFGANRNRVNNFGGGSSFTNNSFSASLDASWELDVWGRIRHNVSAAHSDKAALAADLAAAKQSLIAQIYQAWFELIAHNQRLALAKRESESLEQTRLLTESRFEAGTLSLSDLQVARTDAKNACLLYTSPSPRDLSTSRMPSSA